MTTIQHPTLTGMTYFNGTQCHIESERMSLNNNTMVAAMPTGTSEETWTTSIFGITRNLIITGIFTEYIDKDNSNNDIYLTDFISEINSWVNSGDPDEKTYVSSFGSGVSGWDVLPQSFTYIYDISSIKTVKFTLSLVEGSKIAGG